MYIPESETVQHYPSGTHPSGYQHTQTDELPSGTACGLIQSLIQAIPAEDKTSGIITGTENLVITYPWRLSREEVVTRRLAEIEEKLANSKSGITKEELEKMITAIDQIGSGYEDDIQIYPSEKFPAMGDPKGVSLQDFYDYLWKIEKSLPHDPVSRAEIRGKITKGWSGIRVYYKNSLDANEKLEKLRQGVIARLKMHVNNGGMNGDEVSAALDDLKKPI